MIEKRAKVTFLFLFLLITFFFGCLSDVELSPNSYSNLEFDSNEDNVLSTNNFQKDVIIYFNESTYNTSVVSRFEYYGGIVKDQWNNLFSSFSGFSGIISIEQNKTLFLNEFSDAQIDNNEILETQMNYASIQAGAINSSWFLNGYKGETNCSVVVLDTGINPSHEFFPDGYNPSDLSGDIVGWENFVDDNPISDDNGHGTYISSIISGTGSYSYNSSIPVIVKIDGNYSHIELFEEFSPAKNYSLKMFSFNASKPFSSILVNSSWNWEVSGIDDFWIELYYDNTLVGYSHNINTDFNYIINYSLPQDQSGIYDLYIKYHKELQSTPIFSLNSSIIYYPEYYIEDYKYFTGIANGTKLVSYKILNQSGIGYSSDLISALAYVINNRSKLHIISVCLSIGTIGEDVGAINKAIDEVIKNGVIVVIAAGNLGIETSDALNNLATNKNAIVVGAINDNDQVTSYSSMGKTIGNSPKPDIVAPGGSKLAGYRTIISAGRESEEITTNYGTSIATAIVSAAINLMIEAKWNNWNEWNQLNLTEMVKYIKAILLMTATETNMQREDDPFTSEDESNYSPSFSFSPLNNGLKDIHEGYGRINIQAAIEALRKSLLVNTSVNGNLISSQENPKGAHVFARQIELIEDQQYLFNLSIENTDADFDLYLFANTSDQYGEPILLESSRKWFSDFDYFYFIPKENQTNCIITVKAIEGASDFILNVSVVENLFEPVLEVPEINYFGGSKNTTIMSFQEFMGNNPNKNYSIDSYRFYIEYYDNDTSNVPPQEVFVSIMGISKNYTLSQFNPLDSNYSNGALYMSDYIKFPNSGVFQYFFLASDGKFTTRYPKFGSLNITIEFPTDSIQFPSEHDFNEGIGNWTYTGTGWNLLQQTNTIDNRSRVYQNSWNSMYFGTYHSFPLNYTYQPIRLTEDPYPNGSLISPLYNLTQLNKNNTFPYAKFGVRVSIHSGDFIYLQVNLNWTGWTTIKTYTNEETDWFIEEINLTEYIGNFIQFKFETYLDNTFDPINYKGFILDYFSIKNYTNIYSPIILFNIDSNIPLTHESKFHQFTFTCEYYDLDDNYPQFVFIEMENNNYSMYNIYGDWNASSFISGDFGILFKRSLFLDDISNQSFRFHVSDGKYFYTSLWYNENNSIFQFNPPDPLHFNIYQDQKYIGYKFSNKNISDYYISGFPSPKEFNAWLGGDNTWHPILRLGKNLLYGGNGQSFGSIFQGYGTDWDANLITKAISLQGEYKVYLEYNYEIALQNEFFQPEDQLDRCVVSISKDFGETWSILKEYTYETESLLGSEKIDISQYSKNDVMIKFTLSTNNVVMGLGYGWLLSDIYIGYDNSTDFIAPELEILSPLNEATIKSVISIKAKISDNVELDESRIYVFLNDKSVDRTKLKFNSTTNILEFTWNTKKYNDGTYEIKVVAYDKSGNFAEKLINVKVNNFKWWNTWAPYIILITCVVILGIILYLFAEKKGKYLIRKIKDTRAEKIRLSEIDKEQTIKRIELIEKEEERSRPLIVYCKYCRSWFFTEKFDIFCPNCDRDQIFAAYSCKNCGKWYLKGEPSENYYCKKKTCKGVRLIRREREEIQDILAQKGKVLRKFEKKRKKFSILDNE
ncbi:MAG: S8 family serine peptidase [Promethearchaeota archaeon]